MPAPNPASTLGPGASKPGANTPAMSVKKWTKFEVAARLQGKNERAGFKGTVMQWVKANAVAKHLEADKAKRGIPTSDQTKIDEWEQEDAIVFEAIEAKLSAKIQAMISSAEDAAMMWQRLVSTYDITDMVAIVSSKQALYSHRMLKGEKIEDHL